MMIRKFIFILIFGLITSSCGFNPIYSSQSQNLMNIELVSDIGDNDINLGIKKKLRIHKNFNTKLIKLNLETKYTKVDLSKNDKGEIQDYQLNVIAIISINKNNSEKTVEIKESFTMQNMNDDFEEANYEKRIKENFALSIYQKLIMQLIKIQ